MKTVRILLSKAASDALTAAGEDCFAVICRAMRGTDEDTAGRWVIHLVPVTMKTAADACDVLLGRKIARNLPRAKSK